MKGAWKGKDYQLMRGVLRVIEGILLFVILVVVMIRMVEKGAGKEADGMLLPVTTKTEIEHLEHLLSTTVEDAMTEDPFKPETKDEDEPQTLWTTPSEQPGSILIGNPTADPTAVVEGPTANPTMLLTTISLTPIMTSTPICTATPTTTPVTKLTPALTTGITVTTKPTAVPTQRPTSTPTTKNTLTPTRKPTSMPTVKPTNPPTTIPTSTPTTTPTAIPTATPTTTPTAIPTATPTTTPMAIPTATPTPFPSVEGTLTRRTDIEALLMKKINAYRKSMGISAWEDPYAFDFVTESGVQIGDYLYGKVMPVAQRNAKEKSAEHSPGQMGAFTEAFPTDTAEEVADILFNLWKNSPAHNAQMLSDWRYPNGDGTYVFEERANIAVLVVYQYAKGYYYDTYAAVWMDTAAQESQRR